MATIGIKGVRVNSVDIKYEDGKDTITANYSLMSTADKVLANQSIGGYQGMDIKPGGRHGEGNERIPGPVSPRHQFSPRTGNRVTMTHYYIIALLAAVTLVLFVMSLCKAAGRPTPEPPKDLNHGAE